MLLSLIVAGLLATPPPSPPGASEVCHDACFAAADGECDDGGHGSAYNVCGHGSDCIDCGTRPADSVTAHTSDELVHFTIENRNRPAPPSPPGATTHCSDHCFAAGDGDCDDGGDGSTWAVCAHGSDCADCGHRLMSPPPPPSAPTGSAPPASPSACSNACFHNSDGDCDDGGEGAHYALCDHGTDCEDCGFRLYPPPGPPSPPAVQPAAGLSSGSVAPPQHVLLCDDSCWHTSDGECDDGGMGSYYSLCDTGSDCMDCGHRVVHAGDVPMDATIVASSDPGALQYKLVKRDVECASADARLGDFGELRHCAEACASTAGCTYFIFGKGSKMGSCWAEFTESHTCPDGFEQDEYDFYALHGLAPQARDESGTGTDAASRCSDDCRYAGDEECDDGGVGSVYSLCPWGSDCSDCGTRDVAQVSDGAASPPATIDPPPPPASSPPPPLPPPPVVALWMHAAVPADVRSSHDEIFYAVSTAATIRAPEELRHRFHAQFEATNEEGDDDVPPSALPVSIQQIVGYAISYTSELELPLSSLLEAVREQACARAEFHRECSVSGHLSHSLSTSTGFERYQTAEVTVRRSLHHGETLRVVPLDASRLRRFLDAQALPSGSQDSASQGDAPRPRWTAPPWQEADLTLGAPPAVQEILVKVDVSGWEVDALDVAALKPAVAAPLHVSPQLISIEAVHAAKGEATAAPTSPRSDAPRATPGAQTDVFGSGVATEAATPTATGASTPDEKSAPSGGKRAAPDFHVVLGGILALAACLALTCCALFAYQLCVLKRRDEGKRGSKLGCPADDAENGTMRSVVEAHPNRIFARKASARGVSTKPLSTSSSSTAASSSARRMPKLHTRVLEMGAFSRSKSRAVINPLRSGTAAAAGMGPPGARTYSCNVQTSEIAPAELPNPFLAAGLPAPPFHRDVERPRFSLPASSGLAAEDGEHDVSNRACMYDEMSRREEADERA